MDEITEKAKAQKEYCEKSGSTQFAPTNGWCWMCKKQIYTKISLEQAKNNLITGCPHCHYSFCN